MKQENYYFLSDKYCPVVFLTINPKRRRHVINMASTDANILLSDQHSKQLLPNTVLELIFGAFGVSGNSIVLLMYTRFITDKSGTRYFIPILALVDLTGCVSSVTSFYLDNTMGYVYPSANLCKTMMFLIIMSGGFFCSSDFCYRVAAIPVNLPPLWSADDSSVPQNCSVGHFSFLAWIRRSVLEVCGVKRNK